MLRNLLLAVLSIAVAAAADRTMAQVTTDSGASIIVFPKVVADSSADTIIQLVTLSDNSVDARCAYVDGRSTSWQASDFPVALGPRRPVQWTAARGVMTGTGPDAIDIPAAPAGFRGECAVCRSTAPARRSAATSWPARRRSPILPPAMSAPTVPPACVARG